MKILMLSWEYPPRIVGGISRVVCELARKLAEGSNEVHIITYCEDGMKEFEKEENVYVHRVHLMNIETYDFVQWVTHFNIAVIQYAICLINEYGKFDIIHAHDWLVAFAAVTLKNSYCTPLIATIHATESGRNYGIHNDMQRYISGVEWWLTYEACKVIVNSHYMKNELENNFNLPEDKLVVINNGILMDKFDGYTKDIVFRRNYAADNEKIVFFVGRLVNEKGVHILIDAMPKVLSKYNDVKLVIAGKGPQLDYLKNRAYELGILNRIYFTGYISEEDLKKMYKCIDIAVFPSLYEPFGIVALEAMLAGVPVVVSDTGGLGCIIEHDEEGLKSYTGNSNSVADCIIKLLYNPQIAYNMALKAKEKVVREFNWDILVDEVIQIYKSIIDCAKETSWEQQFIKKY